MRDAWKRPNFAAGNPQQDAEPLHERIYEIQSNNDRCNDVVPVRLGAGQRVYQQMVENLQDWRMPHADIIKEENIKTFIKDWIDNGAKE